MLATEKCNEEMKKLILIDFLRAVSGRCEKCKKDLFYELEVYITAEQNILCERCYLRERR
ncbi:MAG: hypothetical protein ACUVTD_09580 [Nitrososphaerales archaeon]